MDFGSVRALCLDVGFDLHGVDATVTPPGEPPAPVVTKVLWLQPGTELVPSGFSYRGVESRLVACIKRSALASVPNGTTIVGPGFPGGVIKTWVVDGDADPQADAHRKFVREVPA